MQPLKVSAFALPVANGEIHERQFGDVAEIGDGKKQIEKRIANRCHRARSAVCPSARSGRRNAFVLQSGFGDLQE